MTVITKKMTSQAGLAFSIRVCWVILNYLSVILLARWFSPVNYGVFSFIISLVTFLGILSAFGSQTAIMRFLGEYKASGQYELVSGIVNFAQSSVLGVSLTITIVGVALVAVGADVGLVQYPLALSVGLLLLPAFTLNDTNSGIARSFGLVIAALAPRDVFWRGSIIVIAWTVVNFIEPPGMQLLIFLSSAVVSLSVFISWQTVKSRRCLPLEARRAKPQIDWTSWRRVAWPIWLASVANVSLRTADVLLLGLLLSEAAVGHYFAASRTAALTGFVLLSINLVSGPQIAYSYHSGDTARLRKILAYTSFFSVMPALIIASLYIVFGDIVLSWFGPDFVTFYPVLIVLTFGQVISSFFGSSGLMLDLTGAERINTIIVLSFAGLSIVGVIILTPILGPVGAAISSSFGLAAANFVRWLYIRVNYSIDTSAIAILATIRG